MPIGLAKSGLTQDDDGWDEGVDQEEGEEEGGDVGLNSGDEAAALSAKGSSAGGSQKAYAGKGKKGKGKGRGRGRGGAKAKPEAKPKAQGKHRARKCQNDEEVDESANKQCSSCKETLPIDCFHPDQGKCKQCNKRQRSFTRLIEVDGLTKEMQALQKTDPKEHKKVYSQYCKHVAEQEKFNRKQSEKFSMHAFLREYTGRKGLRQAAKFEMMWEAEFLEWAKSPKAGFLSKSEAEARWAAMLEDQSVPKDEEGPRGYMRCRIKVSDCFEDYEDGSVATAVQSQKKLPKNLTDEQLGRHIQATRDTRHCTTKQAVKHNNNNET